MDSKVEHIIKNYQYFELNDTQRTLISEWAKNSDEFEVLKVTLLAADQFAKSKEEDLNPTIKRRLDVRFAEKHDHQRLAWYNKMWFFLWPKESPFYKRPLIQFAAICLVVAFTVPFFPDFNQEKLAMNEVNTQEKAKSEEKSKATPEEEIVNSEEVIETEQQETNEESPDQLNDKKDSQTITNAQDRSIVGQKGWALNEEQTVADAESASERVQDALKDVPTTREDHEDANYYKSDVDALAVESVDMKRLDKNVKMHNKVEVKETLDLLTALY